MPSPESALSRRHSQSAASRPSPILETMEPRLLLSAGGPGEEAFSWQSPHATVVPTGDLEWAPQPFEFEAGDSQRYIDFEGGSDATDGLTPGSAWKHHPWDPDATGNADLGSGPHTYIFKRGVTYRGRLVQPSADVGLPGDPIRLTSAPDWGSGEARFYGSEALSGWTRDSSTVEPRIPNGAEVYYTSLLNGYDPRLVCMVDGDGTITRLKLARTSNWTPKSEFNILGNTWAWDWVKEGDPGVLSASLSGTVTQVRLSKTSLRYTPQSSGKIKLKYSGNSSRDHVVSYSSWTTDSDEYIFAVSSTALPYTYQAGWEAYVNYDRFVTASDSMLNGSDPDYYLGALCWTQWHNMMAAPYPHQIDAFSPDDNSVRITGAWSGSTNAPTPGDHYWLEDKPQYLDEPGEFWHDKTNNRLYVRLPGDVDPETVTVEAARHQLLLESGNLEHVEVSGLTFRFGNIGWDLDHRIEIDPRIKAAAIHLQGDGEGISIHHCTFEHMATAVWIEGYFRGSVIDNVYIADNDMAHLDHEAMVVADRFSNWKVKYRHATLGKTEILRNRIREVGARARRVNGHHTVNIIFPSVAEIAGNLLQRVHASGLFVLGGKGSTDYYTEPYDAPLSRILIHHNKVEDALLTANDWGAIETWFNGPFYVYNNVSSNPVGPIHNFAWGRFGGAYYLDHSYKNYVFNNIAWGQRIENQEAPPAFQQVWGQNNTLFNNTAHNLKDGTSWGKAQGGRRRLLGNILEDCAETAIDDSKNNSSAPPYETLAYAGNVFAAGAQKFIFEPSGTVYTSVGAFSNALANRKAMADSAGIWSSALVLEDPDGGDFRPKSGSAAISAGIGRVFVPWSLAKMVGEWHFNLNQLNPSEIIDEAWYAKETFVDATRYDEEPTYPLTGVNIDASDFDIGPLDSWVQGALTLDGSTQHLYLDDITTGYNPEIEETGFILEAYLQTTDTSGLIAGKMDATHGWKAELNASGGVDLTVKVNGIASRAEGTQAINDGQWHHLLIELDRGTNEATIFVDGVGEPSTFLPTLGNSSLGNSAQLRVGEGLACTLEFMRISKGTLADARTSIDELHAWQFDGPALRDFTGAQRGVVTDAGAILGTPGLEGDVNGDGAVDADDIDRLFEEIRTGGGALRFDLNLDLAVDSADADHLIRTVLGTEYGDANLDGSVSDADYTLWADHYGQVGAGWAGGDFNGNATVTEADYTLWADNYGL